MKSQLGFALLLLMSSLAVAEPSLIPWPAKVTSTAGSFTVDAQTPICVSSDAERAVAEQLRAVVKATHGFDLKARDCRRDGITLKLSPPAPPSAAGPAKAMASAAAASTVPAAAKGKAIAPAAAFADAKPIGPTAAMADKAEALAPPAVAAEGYTLDVNSNGVRIEARTVAGLYYGAMTAAQLISSGAEKGGPVTLNGVHIEDQPRFKWRGLMLDTTRHFFSVADVKMILDQMGQHKLNVFHFHLTDDQGWRIEIKRYPELTKIGAWRTPPSGTGVYGGFYTQDEIRDIVRYAADRHITIVPEIDLPGHAQAVVAAHPKLSVLGDQPKVSNNWGVNDYLYNTNEYSLTFVKNVLDEVLQLFPSKYIHLGGDEAIKDQWKASPAVQAQIKALGLTNEDELQNWFMQQLGVYLAEHDRIMVGWDEILDAAVPSTATVMSWRGIQGAITAARLGHDVVMSPAPGLYFDNLQSRRDDEPAGRLNVAPLSQVYNFEVMPAVVSADERRHILGAQANLWSEYLPSSWYLQHATFPRIDALAEAVWTPQSKLNWAGFLARLPNQMQRYQRQQIAAADSAFAVDFQLANGRNEALKAGAGTVALFNQTGFGEIRFTLDGSAPTRQSKLYSAPLNLQLGAVVKAMAFAEDGVPLAAERTYNFTADALLTRTSNQLHTCPGDALGLRLPLTPDSPTVAPVFNVNLLNSCYIYAKAPLANVTAFKFDIARLPRNFGLANRKNQLKLHPPRTPFGELVVYRDRCDAGNEIAHVALADPSKSDNRQTLNVQIVPPDGERDLCFLFTGAPGGPLYAIDSVRLVR